MRTKKRSSSLQILMIYDLKTFLKRLRGITTNIDRQGVIEPSQKTEIVAGLAAQYCCNQLVVNDLQWVEHTSWEFWKWKWLFHWHFWRPQYRAPHFSMSPTQEIPRQRPVNNSICRCERIQRLTYLSSSTQRGVKDSWQPAANNSLRALLPKRGHAWDLQCLVVQRTSPTHDQYSPKTTDSLL